MNLSILRAHLAFGTMSNASRSILHSCFENKVCRGSMRAFVPTQPEERGACLCTPFQGSTAVGAQKWRGRFRGTQSGTPKAEKGIRLGSRGRHWRKIERKSQRSPSTPPFLIAKLASSCQLNVAKRGTSLRVYRHKQLGFRVRRDLRCMLDVDGSASI